MSILDRVNGNWERQKYDMLEEILQQYSKGPVAPMDFYTELFPAGSFGDDLKYGVAKDDEHDGKSYGIFGIIPDISLYKVMKRWLDSKNGLKVKGDAGWYDERVETLTNQEMQVMANFYLTAARSDSLLNEYMQSDLYRKGLYWLTKEEREYEYEFVESKDYEVVDIGDDWSKLGVTGDVPEESQEDILADLEQNKKNYKKELRELKEKAAREEEKAKLRQKIKQAEEELLKMKKEKKSRKEVFKQEMKIAAYEYKLDPRYLKLDAQFGARRFNHKRIEHNADGKIFYKPIQAEWMFNQRVDSSLRQIGLCQGQQSCLMAPFDYYGRKHSEKTIGNMYAIVLDIDDLKPETLTTFFSEEKDFFGFRPTYIVQSGTGLHFYYFLDVPLAVCDSYKRRITEIKNHIAKFFVNKVYCYSKTKPDFQDWAKQFRVVGSKSKIKGKFVNAYRVGEVWSLKDLVDKLIWYKLKVDPIEQWHIRGKSGWTRQQWLDKQEEIRKARDGKTGRFPIGGRGFFDSWVERMRDRDTNAIIGTRYNTLCIYYANAAYCGVPFEEADKLAMTEIYEFYNSDLMLAGLADKRLLKSDIRAASKFYQRAYSKNSFSIDSIEELTGIKLPRNRRNGLKQEEHLKIARAIQTVKNPNWRNMDGRPSVEQEIREYMKAHPDARKCDVIKGTGKTKPTVYKYYDKIKEELK